MHHLPFALAAAGLAAATIAAPAPAVDETKPSPPCGQQLPDKAGDAPQANLDFTGGFFKHDAEKKSTTINLVVKELDKTIPEGNTFVSWNLYWTGPDAKERFVRGVVDFSGVESYEFGTVEDGGSVTVSRAGGVMPGRFFDGKDGIVQLEIPENFDGKPGTALASPNAITYTGAPGAAAAPTPTRGPLTQIDTSTGKTYTVGACPAAPGSGPGAPPSTPAPAPAPTTAPPTGAAPADQKLPVKVLTKKARRGKRVTIKLSSTEKLTKLSAQLVKGRMRPVGTGALARLSGKGKLELKLKGRPAKGAYRLDMAGTDAKGVRRFGSYRVTLR
jgi:hypothetical protein